MRQVMKTFLLAVLLGLGLLPSARAYSLGGPIGNNPKPNPAVALGDSWQVPLIGYGLPGDLNAPKNLGEEYRRNVPTYFYAYDTAFLDYFGSNGVAAVDGAFTIMNNLTNVSSYTKPLSEFPAESRHVNYQAQALGLYDLKSFTLGVLMEQIGLADPIRYAWTLHDRAHVGAISCPVGMEYLVVQRNYDITSSPLNQFQYSPYVNDTLYSYQIAEFCQGPNPLALAVPFSVDPLADTYSPVASFLGGFVFVPFQTGSGTIMQLSYAPGLETFGAYYTGLTRDDVAGLRYMLQTNNINWETIAPDSLVYSITTNTTPGAQQVFPPYLSGGTNVFGAGGGYYVFNGNTNGGGLGYGDLAAFLAFARSNGPAALQAAYPGVIISSVSNSWVVASNATYTGYYKPAPVGSPYGSPPTFVVLTNYTPVFQFLYSYTFANVFTNHYTTNSTATLQTVTLSAPVGSPYGSPAVTNKTVKLVSQPSGDFFVLPTFYSGNFTFGNNNYTLSNVCPLNIVSPGISAVLATTNFVTGANTNFVTATNVISTSNSVYLITYFTNYSYVINPVTCATVAGATGLYQGIENLKFVKSSYDSLLGQYFQPITNNYTMVTVVNSQAQVQHLQRIVTVPDFTFDAADITTGPSSNPHPVVYQYQRNLDFNQGNALTGLAGPGTITTPTTITYNKVGPVYYNSYGDVMDGAPYFNATPGGDISDLFYTEYYVWGSFDGTTNAPVVYPNGTSIDNLENQILIQVSPTSVPDGNVGFAYSNNSATFTATGGSFSQPYTWSVTGLPSGMTIVSNSDNTGTLTGTPDQSGTFPFTLILTDALGRSVQWNYSLTIQP